ncbi:hypothetical protein BH20ACT24_BH20ACT24_20290 [soil metagenome]
MDGRGWAGPLRRVAGSFEGARVRVRPRAGRIAAELGSGRSGAGRAGTGAGAGPFGIRHDAARWARLGRWIEPAPARRFPTSVAAAPRDPRRELHGRDDRRDPGRPQPGDRRATGPGRCGVPSGALDGRPAAAAPCRGLRSVQQHAGRAHNPSSKPPAGTRTAGPDDLPALHGRSRLHRPPAGRGPHPDGPGSTDPGVRSGPFRRPPDRSFGLRLAPAGTEPWSAPSTGPRWSCMARVTASPRWPRPGRRCGATRTGTSWSSRIWATSR